MATDERTVLEQNKAVVRRYLEEVYRGNYAVLDEVISPETTRTARRTPRASAGGALRGRLRSAAPRLPGHPDQHRRPHRGGRPGRRARHAAGDAPG